MMGELRFTLQFFFSLSISQENTENQESKKKEVFDLCTVEFGGFGLIME